MNDQAIRRALLRRSCPVRGPFEPGQLVMYWLSDPKPAGKKQADGMDRPKSLYRKAKQPFGYPMLNDFSSVHQKAFAPHP